MLLKLAWRNLWRNTRRTAITLLALTLGVTAIIGIDSFRESANAEMIGALTRGMVGHIQIHGRGYQETPEMTDVVRNPDAVEAAVHRTLPKAELEERVVGAGLAGAGEAATAVSVMGVQPGAPGASGLMKIEKGRTLAAKAGNEAVVGTGLAAQLALEPGSELVLVGQAADGSLANDRFTVVGVADAGSYEANASSVFLPLAVAQSFFALGTSVHEVILRLPGEPEDLSAEVARLRTALDTRKLEVLPWTDILPELESAMKAKAKNQRLIDVIVFFIVALGVLNTMTMSTFERTRELGVMRSLGTRPRRILAMVGLEAALQGILGFAIGLGLAFGILHGLGTVDLGGLGSGDVMGARMPATLTLAIDPPSVLAAFVTAALTMLAGGLIPALRAARMQPVEATRYV